MSAQVAEDLAEIGQDTIQLAQDVVKVGRNNHVLLVGGVVVAVGTAAYLGYTVGVKRTTIKYDEILKNEIAEAKEFYKRAAKSDEFETIDSTANALLPEAVEALQEYQGGEGEWEQPKSVLESRATAAPTQIRVETTNVFVDNRDDRFVWDQDVEDARRAQLENGVPYVISEMEHEENAPGHEQATLTWYEKDQVLLDDKDEIVDNVDYVAGEDNLLRFGEGTMDKNLLYVRNDRITLDLEIIRSFGSYAEEVLGESPTELRHSSDSNRGRRPVRKFRGTDE